MPLNPSVMNRKLRINIFVLATAACLSVFSLPLWAQTSAGYLYHLSDFNGTVQSLWARVSVDPRHGEVYTLNRSDAAIQIFSDTAMQVFGYGEGLSLAAALDIASGDHGDIYLLTRSPVPTVRHLNYRGEQIDRLLIDDLGCEGSFQPDYIDYRAGRLFLADAEKCAFWPSTNNKRS